MDQLTKAVLDAAMEQLDEYIGSSRYRTRSRFLRSDSASGLAVPFLRRFPNVRIVKI